MASMLRLLAWMAWDLLHHRHFDALSAIVLAGIVLSLAALAISGDPPTRAFEEPMVSGMIGASFLVSLLLPRPLVYYLGRSCITSDARRSPAKALKALPDSKTTGTSGPISSHRSG